MLAEAANTIFEQGHKAKNLARFSVLLKLNQKKFNSELSNCLLALVQKMQSDDEDHVEAQSSAFASAPTLESRLREVAAVRHGHAMAQPRPGQLEFLSQIGLQANTIKRYQLSNQ